MNRENKSKVSVAPLLELEVEDNPSEISSDENAKCPSSNENEKDKEIARLKRLLTINGLSFEDKIINDVPKVDDKISDDDDKIVQKRKSILIVDRDDMKRNTVAPKKVSMASEALAKFCETSSDNVNEQVKAVRMGIPTLDPFVVDTRSSVAKLLGGKTFSDDLFKLAKGYIMLLFQLTFWM